MTIHQAAARLRAGTQTATGLLEHALEAIARDQPRTNAFIRVDAEGARAAARIADEELARGIDRGPLHGIPISLKDLIDVAGTVTSAGSRVLLDRVAPADAPVVMRLRAAGAVLIGKTNLHEFALGTTSDDSAFGAVHHPLDAARSAGGSSGGSAVAVACGMGLASIGTDTGRVDPHSRRRLRRRRTQARHRRCAHTRGDSAEHVVRSRGADRGVRRGRRRAVGRARHRPVPGLTRTMGRPRTFVRLRGYFDAPVAPVVRAAIERALDHLARAGATIIDAELPDATSILEHYVNIVLPEGAAWHARYLDSRAGDYSRPCAPGSKPGGPSPRPSTWTRARFAVRSARTSMACCRTPTPSCSPRFRSPRR